MVGVNVSRDPLSPLWRLAGFWMPITELGGRSFPLLEVYGALWLLFLILLPRIMRSWSGLALLGGLSVAAMLTFGVAQQRLPFEPILLGLLVNAEPDETPA
jgi:hypothetical protein